MPQTRNTLIISKLEAPTTRAARVGITVTKGATQDGLKQN